MCDESTQEYCGDQFTPTSELNLKFISFIPSKTLCSASFFCLLRMRTSSRFPTLYPPSNIPLPGVAGAAWEPSEQEHSSCPLTHIVAFLTTPSPPPPSSFSLLSPCASPCACICCTASKVPTARETPVTAPPATTASFRIPSIHSFLSLTIRRSIFWILKAFLNNPQRGRHHIQNNRQSEICLSQLCPYCCVGPRINSVDC
jgi:hypothetical protein